MKQYYLNFRGGSFGPPCTIISTQCPAMEKPCITLENRLRIGLFMWDRTDRQTDRQKDRQTDENDHGNGV